MKNIVRVRKNNNFVVMDKTFLNDTSLSWKAKGIMAYMLSKPDNWTFYINELIKHSTDGEASFRAGFKELQEQGYVKRYPIRKGNRIVRWETVVLENPLLGDFQHVENLDVENLDVENRTLLNNNNTNNDNTNNDTNIPYAEIIEYLNQKTGKKFRHSTQKTRSLIKARWNEGFRLDDFKKVIDICTEKWKGKTFSNGQPGDNYLQPSTLFNGKFEERLNWVNTKQPTKQHGKTPEQLEQERLVAEMKARLGQ